jgi:hypothetical protein
MGLVWMICKAGFVTRDGEVRLSGKMGFVYKHYVNPVHMKEEFEFIFTIL